MINTDGAFSPVTGRGGWGALARDNDGDLIVAEAGSVPAAADALHTETYAVLCIVPVLSDVPEGTLCCSVGYLNG
jgi:hypothetical protein